MQICSIHYNRMTKLKYHYQLIKLKNLVIYRIDGVPCVYLEQQWMGDSKNYS